MKVKVIGKITDGNHVVLKHLATISNTLVNSDEFMKINIKEHNIESYCNHVVYPWFNNFIESDKAPDWMTDESNNLYIIVMHA